MFLMSRPLFPSYTNSHLSGALSSLSSPSLVHSYRKEEGKAGGQNHILCLLPVHSGLDLVTLFYVTFYYHLWLCTSLFYFLKPNYTYSFQFMKMYETTHCLKTQTVLQVSIKMQHSLNPIPISHSAKITLGSFGKYCVATF